MRVYLDNCCFNRPFDDQESLSIRLESEAKMIIQSKIRDGKLELVWSYILYFENDANPDEEIKNRINEWKELAVYIQLGSKTILSNGKNFQKLGLSEFDAIHLACAIESESNYFITTDKGILKKRNRIFKIKIINPSEFIVNE
ncbi:MAG: PIN domain protein [Leptospiraceae bacterium]|nr:PIN domain protein [Leptospiraceae bacterium]